MATQEELLRRDLAIKVRASIDDLYTIKEAFFRETQRTPPPDDASLRDLLEHVDILVEDVRRVSGGLVQLPNVGPIDDVV